MRLLRELMLGLGDDGVLGAAFGDNFPLGAQDDNFSPLTCGCAACASAVNYQATLAAAGRFDSDFTTLWTFQGEPGSVWASQVPTDGPQEVNESGGDLIPGSIATTYTLTLGQTETGRANSDTDDDWFAVTLVAGQSYEFTLVGTGGNPVNDPYLELRNDAGQLVHFDDDGGPGITSRLLFTPNTSGTYYINATVYDNPGSDVGDYQITFNNSAPQNPLDALNIGYVFPDLTINVYFTTTGEVNSGDTALRNWTQAEINSVMSALASISAVTPLVFTQVFSSASSDFRLSISELGANVLGHFFVGAGNGAFDPDGAGWNSAGMAPGSLGFATIVHEILHGVGLAHPHPDVGDLQIMQGVLTSFNSYGTYLMNQGVFTTMSYNDGWVSPFGVTPSTATGEQGGPMALDIAYLQQLYGATTANTGDNTYALTAANGAYLSIWDTGGIDTIQFAAGNQNTVIDLRAATITTAFGGGGWVSYVQGFHAGWTIANGVVIENATGASGNDTLTGNEIANVLTGNNGDDTLTGNGGDDTLNGGAGFDSMSGGQGNDTYYVDSGSDSVIELGGEGTDTVIAASSYSLGTNVENLTLTGAGPLSATGNTLNNVITGNSGANLINGGLGADIMQGGLGDDTYIADNVGDTAIENASEGTDRVFSAVTFALGANIENLTLIDVAAINGFGNDLANSITGNDADNILDGGTGADTLTGGLGNDTYYVDNASDSLVENASEGTDTVYATITYTLATDFENLTLIGGGAINGTGNGVANIIAGNGQANTLTGLAGNDLLDAGGGDDFLFGGADVDTLYGRAGADALDGGAGADTMFGGDGNDQYYVDNIGDVATDNGPSGGYDTVDSTVTFTLGAAIERLNLVGASVINGTGNELANYINGNAQANVLNGRAGIDEVHGNAGLDTLYGGDGDDTMYGGDDADLVDGGNNNDALNGDAGDDTLYGRAGIDILNGGLGADQMFGGAGDDIYYVDNAGDIVGESAGAGADTIISSLTRSLGQYQENLTLTGSDPINGTGNILANTITGNAGVNTLSGLAGGDTINANDGDDTAFGGDGNDTLNGGVGEDLLDGGNDNDIINGGADADEIYGRTGNDTLNGDEGSDTIYGGDGDDTVSGGGDNDLIDAGNNNDTLGGDAGDDTIYGRNGNDRIDGGLGADTLYGGNDTDTYVFSTALGGGNIDTVAFSVVEDTIELSISIFAAFGATLDAAEFVIGSAAADADDFIIYDAATGALYYDADGNGGGAAVQFATLGVGLALTFNDFVGGP